MIVKTYEEMFGHKLTFPYFFYNINAFYKKENMIWRMQDLSSEHRLGNTEKG